MLSENIRSLRKQKGYSQETLAQELNVVRQTVSKWEKGYSVPDAIMLERLAELFEVSVGELLGEEQKAPEENADLAQIVTQLTILNNQCAREMERRRRRRKLTSVILLSVLGALLLCLVLSFISCPRGAVAVFGDVSRVHTTEVHSDIYTQRDIANAIAATKHYFFREFEGCTLTELYYAGDEITKAEMEYYDGEEVIVLLSSFDVDSSGGDGSLRANSTYTDWKWILTRDANGEWQHTSHGYC